MSKTSISPGILNILQSMKTENEEQIDFISKFLLPYVAEKKSYYKAKDEIYQKMKEFFGEEISDED